VHQTVDNLEAISEQDQLNNPCAGRRVRKWRNSWPVSNEWKSNHEFPRGPTARCSDEKVTLFYNRRRLSH